MSPLNLTGRKQNACKAIDWTHRQRVNSSCDLLSIYYISVWAKCFTQTTSFKPHSIWHYCPVLKMRKMWFSEVKWLAHLIQLGSPGRTETPVARSGCLQSLTVYILHCTLRFCLALMLPCFSLPLFCLFSFLLSRESLGLPLHSSPSLSSPPPLPCLVVKLRGLQEEVCLWPRRPA